MLWLGLILLSAVRASAEELPDSIFLRIEDCPAGALKLGDAYAAARLELGQVGVGRIQTEGDERGGRAELTARLRCEAGIQATLRLRVRDDRSSSSRVISLDDASPKDRPRVLALALAELVRSDWAELAAAGEAQPSSATNVAVAEDSGPGPPEAAATPAATRQASQGRSRPGVEVRGGRAAGSNDADRADPKGTPAQPRFRADAILRWFTAYPGITFGAALGLERNRFSAGVEAALGRHKTDRGTASYGFGAATLGFHLLQTEWGRARLALGPKVALGGAWATGSSALPTVVVETQAQLYADARLEAAAGVRWSALDVGARLAGGRATGMAITDRGSVIGATGGWFLGGALGVSW